MSKKASVTPPKTTPSHLQVRTQGLSLINPFRPLVQRLTVETATDYLDADELLGRIRNARKKWDALLDPIQTPIKNMETELKSLKAGVKSLDQEVGGPLQQMELAVKEAMRLYKVEEARQLQEAEAERERQARKLREDIAAKSAREAAAKTPQMRAKLQEARVQTEAALEELESDTTDLQPVKGASSAARTVRKCQIVDLEAFVGAIRAYEPRAGIYREGHPPLSLLKPEMLQVALNRLFAEQPGVVETWPGVRVVDDITIAGR